VGKEKNGDEIIEKKSNVCPKCGVMTESLLKLAHEKHFDTGEIAEAFCMFSKNEKTLPSDQFGPILRALGGQYDDEAIEKIIVNFSIKTDAAVNDDFSKEGNTVQFPKTRIR